MSQDDCDKVLRVRGMPWSATQEDVVNFFEGCNVKEGGVHFLLNREGRSSGEAFVEMGKFSDFVRGLLCNKKMMGSRYIEVFESDTAEMDVILRERGMGKIVKDDKDNDDHDQKLSTEQPGVYRSGGNYIKLRGLPYSSDEVDIIEFFQGLEICRDGIIMIKDYNGRATGDAVVKFASKECAQKALQKHKDKIGHRYIEIFKATLFDWERASRVEYPQQPPPPPFHCPYPCGPPSGYNGHQPPGYYGPMRARPTMYLPRSNPYDRYPPHRPYMMPWPPLRVPLSSPYHAPSSRYPVPGFAGPPRPTYAPPLLTGRHIIHMRGLPFKATEEDVMTFFSPIEPISVTIKSDALGRPSGDAFAEFANQEDANAGMSKDKALMEHRYIELFLMDSHPKPKIGYATGSSSGFMTYKHHPRPPYHARV